MVTTNLRRKMKTGNLQAGNLVTQEKNEFAQIINLITAGNCIYNLKAYLNLVNTCIIFENSK